MLCINAVRMRGSAKIKWHIFALSSTAVELCSQACSNRTTILSLFTAMISVIFAGMCSLWLVWLCFICWIYRFQGLKQHLGGIRKEMIAFTYHMKHSCILSYTMGQLFKWCFRTRTGSRSWLHCGLRAPSFNLMVMKSQYVNIQL